MNEYPHDIEGAAELLRDRAMVPACAGTVGLLSPPSPLAGEGWDEGVTPSLILPRKGGGNEGSPPLLHLQSVTHVYPGDSQAVCDVTLTIEEGEFIALLGQNGSGKTTLAKHLSGLLTPTQGRVFLRGQELRPVPLHRLPSEGSYVVPEPDHKPFGDHRERELDLCPQHIRLS